MRLSTIARIVAVVVGVLIGAAVGFLLMFDFNAYKGVIEQAVRDATGRKLVIEGDFELKLGLSPSITVPGVRFANAPWGSRPDMVRLKALSVEVALLPLFSGDVRIRRVVLSGADILLEADGKGRANWVFGPPAAEPKPTADDAGEAVVIPGFNLVVIENARLTYRDGSGGKPLVFVIDRLEGRAKDVADPVKLVLDGAFNGNRFSLDGAFGAVARLVGGGGWPVDVAIRAGGAEVKVKGEIARPMTGEGVNLSISAAGKDLSALSGLAGSPLPALGPYRISGRLNQNGEAWRFDRMEARLGASSVTGRLEVKLGGARPSVHMTLASKLLDLADFRDKRITGDDATQAPAPAQDAGDGRVFSADPLPLEALTAVDASASLRIDTIRSDKLEITGAAVDMALHNGVMGVRSLRLELAGGEIRGEAEIAAVGNEAEANLRLKLIDIDLYRLLRQLDVTDMVEGELDGDVQLSSRGASVRALMAALDGTISVVMGKGAIDSRYVNLIGADLLRTLVPGASDEEGTTVNCLVSRFLVKNGIATSRALLFDTDLVTVAGTGKVDLGSERLDLTLLPRPKNASLLSLAVPINVRGTLAAPTAAPDTAAVAKKVAVGVVGSLINPLAILVPLVSAGSADENPCVAALAAGNTGAEGGATAPEAAPEKAEESKPASPVKEIGDAIKSIGEGIGKGLKSLFGQ